MARAPPLQLNLWGWAKLLTPGTLALSDGPPILTAGRVQPTQVQCPAAPSALLLPWGDPRGCFTYSSTIGCLFFFLHFSTKSYFYPSQTWYTSCRKISEGARRFWRFSSGGVKSSITWKGDSSSWLLKLKTCGWLMFFADLCSISSQHHLVRVARTWVALQESASGGDHMADWQRDETKPHPNRHGEGDIGEYSSTAGWCGSVENKACV